MDEETGKPIVCVYCGYCAQFCPHKVITLQEVEAV
jgi:formate hydrogenlyase subunit 6/NADH:ubiquinone oxidoreductase subunit I